MDDFDVPHSGASGTLSDEIASPDFLGTGGEELLGSSSRDSARGGIVTARGTSDGLVLRLDGRVSGSSLKEALLDFLNARKGFLTGNEVAIEWVGILPPQPLIDEVSQLLNVEFAVRVSSSTLWEQPTRTFPNAGPSAIDIGEDGGAVTSGARALSAIPGGRERGSGDRGSVRALRPGSGSGNEGSKSAQGGRAPSLFDGIEVFSSAISGEEGLSEKKSSSPRTMSERQGVSERGSSDRALTGFDPTLWDDPDARVIYGTIRSGQKIETEHSLVIFGDVNSGGELVAGGDIVVLGNLRGIAHAGAYDETGGGRVIFALNLQPTQLRIGMTISRGSSESGSVPEIARVDGNLIVVEPYTSRAVYSSRATGSRGR